MTDIKCFKLGKDHCPTCKHLLDAVTPTKGTELPNSGDVSICWYCGEFLQYSEDMALKILPDNVFEDLSAKQKRILLDTRMYIVLQKEKQEAERKRTQQKMDKLD
ncbi:MAG: hypothetical protein V4506_19165, partial [Bacteroidota bacterium]